MRRSDPAQPAAEVRPRSTRSSAQVRRLLYLVYSPEMAVEALPVHFIDPGLGVAAAGFLVVPLVVGAAISVLPIFGAVDF